MRADHLVALLLQQARGHRRIDAAGHGDQDGRAHASRLAPASGPDGCIVADHDRGPIRRPHARRPPFRLVGPVGVFEARRPDEVADVLEAAESSAQRGLWVGGFVAYEAAPGLDPALEVRAREPGDPMADLPLAWFALFEGREETLLPEPRDERPLRPGRRLAPLGRPPERTTPPSRRSTSGSPPATPTR